MALRDSESSAKSAKFMGMSGISPALDRHYSVSEVAALWNLSQDTVRRLFQNEPGVLVVGDENPHRGRRYLTLRIPEHVLDRVHRHYSNAHPVHKE
jgi:hypothetical protein